MLDRQIVTAPPKVAFEKVSDQCEMTHIAEATVRLGWTKQSNFEKPPSNSNSSQIVNLKKVEAKTEETGTGGW